MTTDLLAPPTAPADAAEALLQRLRAVAVVLLPGQAAPAEHAVTPGEQAAELLRALLVALGDRPRRDEVWLLLVAVTTAFPQDDEVRAAQRHLELATPDDSCAWLLEQAYAALLAHGSARAPLELLVGAVVVDVDFTAQHDLQTGMQRVVRRLAPRWDATHEVVHAVWTPTTSAWRRLTDREQERVLRWTGPVAEPAPAPVPQGLLVPWRCTVVLPEVPRETQCQRLAALAEHSGNRVAVIGYDCIPVASADLLPAAEAVKFVRYLSLVKHSDVVAGISETAAEEFRGFVAALPTQGLAGPSVVSVPLALDAAEIDAADEPAAAPPVPEVVVVGSHEPRKNHLAVLYAAEVLWREGLAFRVRFLGGSGWSTHAFDTELARLRRRGRPALAERGLGDAEVWEAFRRARFTVFPSLHEGFGLPVAESLAFGTPVVGTSYGSVGELAAQGGVLAVDPRDDEALVTAMRRLLTDDAELGRLADEAAARPPRTWDDYADDLWRAAVQDPA